jgi:hypothetical protein
MHMINNDILAIKDSILIKEWVIFSNNDLIVAKHCFDDLYPKQIEISCYQSTYQCKAPSVRGEVI